MTTTPALDMPALGSVLRGVRDRTTASAYPVGGLRVDFHSEGLTVRIMTTRGVALRVRCEDRVLDLAPVPAADRVDCTREWLKNEVPMFFADLEAARAAARADQLRLEAELIAARAADDRALWGSTP